MKLCLYSVLLMDGSPFNGDPEHDEALAKSWSRFGLIILSLASLYRNRDILPLVRKHCPNSVVVAYQDAFSSQPWLSPEAMEAEPFALTSQQRKIGLAYDAIKGDVLDITVPGVHKALVELWINAAFELDLGLFMDSTYATCPFEAPPEKHALWHARATSMIGYLHGICSVRKKPFIVNPSWSMYTRGRMSERWPDLEGVDPIASFLAGPGRHETDIIFAGFDPLLPWPSPDEQERRIRYAAGCALVLDAYLCVGPSDLNWKSHGEYWNWKWSIMDTDLGKPSGLPQKVGGRWVRTYDRGLVMVDTQAQTTEVFD